MNPTCDDSNELVWNISWIIAFPTLVPTLLYLSDHDIVWQQLAFNTIIQQHQQQQQQQQQHEPRSSRTNGQQQKRIDCNNNNTIASHNNNDRIYISSSNTLLSSSSSSCSLSSCSWHNSLGYGEISETTVFYLFKQLHSLCMLDNVDNLSTWSKETTTTTTSTTTIVDLGSGTGRVLLAAALCCCSNHPPEVTTETETTKTITKLIGIEIVPSLHSYAINNTISKWLLYNDVIINHKTCTSSSNTKFELICDDFTVYTDWIHSGNIIFIHATVFEDELMIVLSSLCEQCRIGTYFCLVSKKLIGSAFMVLCEFSLEMSWGRGTVFIQKRI